MPTPIRLQIAVDSSGATTIAGIEQLASQLDSSFQYAAQKSTAHFDKFFDLFDRRTRSMTKLATRALTQPFQQISTFLTTIQTQITSIEAALNRLGKGGLGGGGGVGRYKNNPSNALSAIMSQLGLTPTGQSSTVVNAKGRILRESVELANDSGATASLDNNRRLKIKTLRSKLFADQQKSIEDYIKSVGGELVSKRVLSVGAGGRQKTETLFRSLDGSINRYIEDRIRMVASLTVRAPKAAKLISGAGVAAEERGIARAMESMARDAERKGREIAAQQRLINSNTKNLGSLSGANLVGSKITDGPNGQQESRQYQVAAGLFRNARSINLDLGTGKMVTQIEEGSSAWGRMVRRINGDVPLLRRLLGLAFSPLTVLPRMLHSIGNSFIRIAAVFYSLERVGRIFAATFISPVRAILNQTESAREFEAAISGVAGGLGRAHQINEALVKSVQKLPITMKEYRDITRSMAIVPSLAPKFASMGADELAMEAEKFQGMVKKLAVFDPVQGVEGALIALREGFAGDFRSLRLRLEISPAAVAASIGKSVADLKNNPTLFQEAITKFADVFVGQKAVDEMGRLFSVRMEKLYDTFRLAAEKIGNSGLFDDVVQRLTDMAGGLFEYFDSPEFTQAASRISASLSKILTNVGNAIIEFMRNITGTTGDASTISGVVELATQGIEKIAEISEKLGPMAGDIASVFKSIVTGITDTISQIARLADAIEAFSLFQGLVSGERAESLKQTGYQSSTVKNDIALELASQLGLDTSGVGRANQTTRPFSNDSIEGLGRMLRLNKNAALGYFANEKGWSQNQDRALLEEEGVRQFLDFSKVEDVKLRMVLEKVASAVQSMTPDQLASASLVKSNLARSGALASVDAYKKGLLQPGAAEGSYSTDTQFLIRQEMRDFNRSFSEGNIATTMTQFLKDSVEMMETFNPESSGYGRFAANQEKSLASIRVTDTQKGLFERFDEMRTRAEAELDKHEAEWGKIIKAEDPEYYNNKRTALREMYNEAFSTFPGMLIGAVKDNSVALSMALRDVAPESAMIMQQGIMDGTTAYAEEIRKSFSGVGVDMGGVGFKDLGSARQAEIYGNVIGVSDRLADARARYGAFTPVGKDGSYGSSVDEILGQGGMGGRRARSQQLQWLRENAPARLRDMESTAQNELEEAMSNGDRIAIEEAKENLNNVKVLAGEAAEKMRELHYETNLAFKTMVDFGDAVQGSLASNIGSGLDNLIWKTGSLRDALVSFAHDITSAFTSIASKNLINSIFGDSGTQGVTGLGAMFGRMFGGGTAAAANGAVWPGGFQAFANGGMVHKPTLGLVGEGRYPEAIIPMPNGRSVPVTMTGGGQQTVNKIFVVNSVEEAIQQGFNRNRDTMVDSVAGNISRGGSVRKAMRRKPG